MLTLVVHQFCHLQRFWYCCETCMQTGQSGPEGITARHLVKLLEYNLFTCDVTSAAMEEGHSENRVTRQTHQTKCYCLRALCS